MQSDEEDIRRGLLNYEYTPGLEGSNDIKRAFRDDNIRR